MKNNTMNILKVIGAAGLVTVSGGVVAADAAESPWKSSAELGYVNVSGNTNTESLKASFDLSYDPEKWFHKMHAEALSSKSETTDDTVVPAIKTEERTAAKWLITGQSDYKITTRDYAYGLFSYEDDRFSGFEYQAKFGLGYGRKVIQTDVHELKLEIGPGIRYFELEPTTPPAAAVITDRQSETLIRLAAGYIWKISKTAKFTEDLTVELGEDQDEWKSVTALTANINSSLAMKLSYTIKDLDVVPAGTENTDKEAAVTLVYTF